MKNSIRRLKGILTALMYVAVHYAVSALLQTVYVLCQSFNYELSVSEIENNALNSSYALGVIACVISLWIYLIIGKIRRQPLEKTVHNEKVAPMVSIMAVCLAVGARMSVNAYYYFSQSVHLLKKSIDDAALLTPQLNTASQLLAAVFAIVVIAPFFEEILFRGIVFGQLSQIMRTWAAIVLQAILFGIAHAVLFQSIFAFVMGILFGIVYYKTRSVITSALCHSAFNLSVIFSYTDMTTGSAVIIMVFGVLIVISSLMYIIYSAKKS